MVFLTPLVYITDYVAKGAFRLELFLTTYSLTTYSKPMKARRFENGELSLVWNKL